MKKSVIILLKSISGKLRETSGESIAETLVSMLIVVLAFMMLSGAIVASARVNAKTEDQTLYLDLDDSTNNKTVAGASVTVTTGSGPLSTGMTVRSYKMKGTSGTLYYYE